MGISIAGAGLTANYHLIGMGRVSGAPAASVPAATGPDPGETGARIAIAQQQVAQLSEALTEFDSLIRAVRPSRWRAAAASSAADIGFSATPSPTVLRSSEQINTAATSFDPYDPAWSGSTAQATIGGVYLGTQGTGTLSFRVQTGGTRGVDALAIDVYDPNGDFIQRVDIGASDPLSQEYFLSNGLTLTVGAGELLSEDSFSVDVDAGLPTSYSPSAPQWLGSSAIASLDGRYDGAQGTGALTFRVASGGTHGQDGLSVEVYDPGDLLIETINLQATDPLQQQYTLSNGLVFSLGSGDLLSGAAFTVNVYDDQATAVDPARPLDGTGADDARLDPGEAVSDGAFTVNGVSISVNASDSLQTVLDRITQSAADVTASFDAQHEEVVLTRKTPGAAYDVVLANDTSGFLSAMKLAGAASVPGDAATPFATAALASFGTVQSGDVTINGVAISIDVDQDSLLDVLGRISDSAAGVAAALTSTQEHVRLRSISATDPLTIDGGGTGLFAALQIADGVYRPRLGGGVSARRAEDIGAALERSAGALNALFADREQVVPEALETTRRALETAVLRGAGAAANGRALRSDFGVTLDFAPGRQKVFEFAGAEQRQFRGALRSDAIDVREFFVGRLASERGGLVGRLLPALDQGRARMRDALDLLGLAGTPGLLVDRFA